MTQSSTLPKALALPSGWTLDLCLQIDCLLVTLLSGHWAGQGLPVGPGARSGGNLLGHLSQPLLFPGKYLHRWKLHSLLENLFQCSATSTFYLFGISLAATCDFLSFCCVPLRVISILFLQLIEDTHLTPLGLPIFRLNKLISLSHFHTSCSPVHLTILVAYCHQSGQFVHI